MIAQQNLETKTKALKDRVGNLAVEKLSALERIDEIGEEMRQIALLLTVFDVVAADLAKDAGEMASMNEQLDSMAAKIVDLESKLFPLGGMEESKEGE